MRHTSLKLTVLLLALTASPLPSQAQLITTIAGDGLCGNSGDGGPATLASFCAQDDIVLDPFGNLYIADANSSVIRRVDGITGIITTVAGNGTAGFSGDGGPATLASFNYPTGIAFDPAGNMYISDFDNCVIRRVDAGTGIITSVVGGGPVSCGFLGDGGPGTSAELNRPIRVTYHAGALYIADNINNRIRRWDIATGIITTVVGTGTAGFSGDGGLATAAEVNAPEGITFDSFGDLYFTDTANFVVRRVDAITGIITTFAGTPGVSGYSGDGGPATAATFSTEPDDIQEGCNGNLFITDDFNNVIRMVNISTGIISTVAGNGTSGFSGDGGPPLAAQMDHPEAMVLNAAGDLLVADYGNARIRAISLACNPTPTPTSTSTSTPTNTPTSTMTPTRTSTSTPTLTPTFTPTLSVSWTSTSTSTSTPTSTRTPSPTFTSTSTTTMTPTRTSTSTPTLTPTFAIDFKKSTSRTYASSGELFTYDLAVTVSQGPALAVVVTDQLPPELDFSSFLPGAPGTPFFDPILHRIVWTLPAALPSGTYFLTYEVQMKDFVEGGTLMFNQAILASTSLGSPLTQAATVQAGTDFIVRAGVYNEAGELIKTLFVNTYSLGVFSLDLIGNSIGSLNGPDRKIDLYTQGHFLGSWDGMNQEGDPVTNGVYHIKFDISDNFGSVSTLTRQAMVDRQLSKVDVDIFNGAGEVVRHLGTILDDADPTQLTGVTLDQKVVRVGMGPSNPVNLQVVLKTTGTPVTLFWDGKNDVGDEVTPGHYQFETQWDDGVSGSKMVSLGVMVVGGGKSAANQVLATPNSLSSTTGYTSTVTLTPPQGFTLKARIYTTAGELVDSIQGPLGGDTVSWNALGSASGLYFAVVEFQGPSGTLHDHRILKIAVLR